MENLESLDAVVFAVVYESLLVQQEQEHCKIWLADVMEAAEWVLDPQAREALGMTKREVRSFGTAVWLFLDSNEGDALFARVEAHYKSVRGEEV